MEDPRSICWYSGDSIMVMSSSPPAPGMCLFLMTHTTTPTIPINSMMQTTPPTMALVAAMGNEVGGAVVGEGRERCVEMVGSMSVDSEGVGAGTVTKSIRGLPIRFVEGSNSIAKVVLLHALGICLIYEEGAVTRVISGLPV